jgi:hypothetical protein
MNVRTILLVACLAIAGGSLAGCDLPSSEPVGSVIRSAPAEAAPGPPAQPLAQPGLDLETPPGGIEVAQETSAAAGVELPPVEVSTPNTPAPAAASAATAQADNRPNFQLSAGVAVPQSLPGGTQIGVSVDYRTLRGVDPSSQYLLIVASSAGETTLPVELDASAGTIEGFLPPSVRPEDQPFHARIEERHAGSAAVKASNTLRLQTSY